MPCLGGVQGGAECPLIRVGPCVTISYKTDMAIKRTSHAVYDTSYHVVWCPKYRKKIFEQEELRGRAEQMIREISEDYGFEVIEMEIAQEHIHILLSFPPRKSI